ncbi:MULTISPECIES: peptidoglycan-binding protein LysM [Flavobacterium]|uniref:Peptidoglycan-binding protein LysM n=1 Tax=Flavobacterium jumunjinense TaxID=998845 RepID=A0ABV5GMZ6_9FLAO|nr:MULTISPECIES: peptidoglycan-binding protein LysM [Flavobacterium]
MVRKGSYFLGLTILVVLVSSGFNSIETKEVRGFYLTENEVVSYHVPSEDENEIEDETVVIGNAVPYVGRTFAGFKQAIAFKESRGILNMVNSYGYMGKYQFGKTALRCVGVYDFQEFLRNADWQEKAFKALLSINKWELRKEIKKYNGKVINGVKITESGILAAAHLGGAGSVKKYLRSNGRNGFKDGFGTSLKSYLKKFGGYDVSHVPANRNAKVKLN